MKVTWTDTGTNGDLWEISGKAPIQIQIERSGDGLATPGRNIEELLLGKP